MGRFFCLRTDDLLLSYIQLIGSFMQLIARFMQQTGKSSKSYQYKDEDKDKDEYDDNDKNKDENILRSALDISFFQLDII